LQLSAEHRRFLVVDQGAIPIVINLLLNGGIAWLLFRSVASVPLWGESSIGVDLIATAILLPFLTCVIVSPLVAAQVRSGKLSRVPSHQLPSTGWSQRPVVVRGLFLAAGCLVFAAAPLVTALTLGQSRPFEVNDFIAFKALWAALLAAAVTPVVAWWALMHASKLPSEDQG